MGASSGTYRWSRRATSSARTRLLALPPLVWLGRISYGLYLWHWPLFGWFNAERTGLSGNSLLTVRWISPWLAPLLTRLATRGPG